MGYVRKSLVILALVCIATTARAVSPQAGSGRGSLQNTAPANLAPPQIATLRIQWATFLQTKQLDNLISLYSRNAMFLDSAGRRIIGPSAIHNLFRGVLTSFNVNLTLYPLMTETSGDLAYESGNYLEALTQPTTGTTEDIHGTYIMLFKRQPDGTWKILEQMWTQAPNPQAQKQ